MLKKRISKIILVLACVMVLTAPYTTVFAKLTQEDTTAELQSLIIHEGGEEASGTLTEEQRTVYDEKQYGYTVGTTPVLKIVEKNDPYSDALYCLNAKKSFPGVASPGQNSLEYKNVADFKDSTNSEVKSLHLSTPYSDDNALWTSNYKALTWLFDNMYLRKETPEQKDDFLTKAFEGYEYGLDVVKAYLTDDDIDVVQQYAIWYFTNRDSAEYNVTTLPAITLSGFNDDGTTFEGLSYLDATGSALRQEMANYLYQYLINSAIEGKTETVTYPSIVDTGAVATENDEYYVVGPYKVNSGTASQTQYSIKLLDGNGNEIARNEYEVLIEGEDNFTDKNVNEIFDTNYYIYLPKTNTTITNITLELTYSSFGTEASLWKNKTTNDEGVEVYQPVVLLTRGETPHRATVPVEIKRSASDLALRKYIVKVNDTNIDRAPVVDVTNLKNGTSTTAEYKHPKNPVLVSAGDTVIYEIRVYNEGDTDASGMVIIDSIPNGLEFIPDSEINTTYGWQEIKTGENTKVYSSNYLANQTLQAFDKETSDTLDSAYVQIECRISENATASSILTNVAEIAEDNISDIDSIPGNNDYTQGDLDSSNYTGDKDNKEDLTDSDYFYKGREDDDDFEKVQIEGKAFDLSLQKFITKLNGDALAKSREPEVDVTPLKSGTSTDATYTTVKTPLTVEQGDIVIYTIRVYNEGELSGYAEEIADYLPEGLGFLVNHTVNIDNYWSIPADSKTVKLNTITNGTNNLSVDDFNGIKDLSEVDVVIGNAKITSTKLKSSNTDEKNLLQAFDKENSETLDYKDIQVACIVIADSVSGNNFRNIAEITKDSDENKEEITDIDSTPDTVDPGNYPGNDQNQDDNDYENLTTKEPEEFDLSLQKFITGLNGGEITGREPNVSVNSEGKVQFSSTVDPLQVENNDIITYTIRVYNEGNTPGYAKEISDDLPEGLEFLPDNDINKQYGWILYDKDGNETTDLSQAVTVKTDYLSKEKSEEREEDNLLQGFDPETSETPDYRDVQIVFKVVENDVTSQERIIRNIAEITDDEDQNGDPIDDIDSTPGNNKEDEDDIDDEKVYVKYFDLALKKDLIKVIITEDGITREISLSPNDGLQKVEIHRKKLDSTTVKFVYNITVTNEGEIEGTATEITDYIPEGLEFIPEENTAWTQVSQNVITTNALSTTVLEPGASASVQVVLKWINSENNLGLKVNVAEISADHNDSDTPDIDSTPNNKVEGEDDIDNAEIYLGISTGTAPTYIALTTIILAIMSTGVILIKKYVL